MASKCAACSTGEAEGFFVPEGFTRSVSVKGLHHSHRILFYDDGTIRFEHWCDRGDRGIVICAPALQIGNGHEIIQDDPLTIRASISCPDCGTHGFITNGRWADA